MHDHFKGLSTAEVQALTAQGMTNRQPDSTSPTVGWIIFRNAFNLINLFLLPLLFMLAYFDKWQEVLVMSTFAVVNSVIGMYDELSIKRRLDKIQVQTAQRIKVIRNGEEVSILTTDVLLGDIAKLGEGEGVPADGELLVANNLQLDESLLTGESNYIAKEQGEEILGGSFVITGECIFRVTAVGKHSYINKLGTQSKQFRKEKSSLQKVGDKLTVFFIVASVAFGISEYIAVMNLGMPASEAVIPLTSVVSLIIPQTLIFLFTFTFSISVVKLSNIGVLVQRASAVESLVKLDVLCFDKTGTLTSGEMKVVETKYWNLTEEEVAKGFNFLSDKAYGRNRTFETVASYFRSRHAEVLEVDTYNQIPFNSKVKLARNLFNFAGNDWMQFIYGAPSSVTKFVSPKLQDEILAEVRKNEEEGRRVLVGVIKQTDKQQDIGDDFITDKVWVIALKEELNQGISAALAQFSELKTDLKVISGDSMQAIDRILGDINVKLGKAVDLSIFEGDLAEVVDDYSIFSRAKPEDKLTIINALQKKGKLVGMVGDGVNDVLALKLSNLSIAMQSGAGIAQDVSDIVLLNNDFNLIPTVIFEGQNIISNLKFMNLLFVSKTFHAIFLTVACILLGLIFPLLPTSALIYSFMATSLPSYVVAFLRRGTKASRNFWSEVLPDSIMGGILGAIVSVYVQLNYSYLEVNALNTLVMYATLAFGLLFTIYQLYKGNYITHWYQPILIYMLISVVSFSATLIPLARTYYNVAGIGLDLWIQGMIPAGIAFAIYLLVSFVWWRLNLLKL